MSDDHSDAAPDGLRQALRFEWSEVDAGLTRRLLVAAYAAEGRSDEVATLGRMSPEGLSRQAARSLGRPLALSKMAILVDVLRDHWLPSLTSDELDVLIWDLQLTLSGPARSASPSTKSERVAFIKKRNRSETLCRYIRSAFLRAHKIRVTAAAASLGSSPRRRGACELVGTGSVERRHPYPHQLRAWAALDELASKNGGQARGLIVLPTGAGKTFTVVSWLLRRLSVDPSLRVLWIADQQELVEQAARAFIDDAAAMSASATRRLRVVHGGADPASVLGDAELNVVCVTRQALMGRRLDARALARLREFLTRRTVVVVDEAHHAVAPSYQKLLDFIWSVDPRTMTLGLTATPWPQGHGMTKRLGEMFPTEVIDVGVREMVQSGVLARPIFHTVDTGQYVEVDREDLARSVGRDFPVSVLRRLDLRSRNELIVNTWLNRKDDWGKTLVFACTIEHADRLGRLFVDAGVPTTVVHSEREVERVVALKGFREMKGSGVLVSVGMLLEGVDIPDASTAFLARPTTSVIVMRQMIGRVLRGPAAGGEPVAHIVDLRDRWDADIDILAPVEVPITDGTVEIQEFGANQPLPPVRSDSGEVIGEDVMRRIEKAYSEIRAHNPLPHAASLSRTELIGFYALTDLNVPVFDHAVAAWAELISWALGKRRLKVVSALDLFGDLPVPRPTRGDVDAVTEYVRSYSIEPVLTEVRLTFSVRSVAQDLVDLPAMTEGDKIRWQRVRYESSLARSAYSSFQAFHEALQHEVLALTGSIENRADPESPVSVAGPTGDRPRLTRRPTRGLKALLDATVTRARKLLHEAGEDEYADMLKTDRLPAVDWTTRPRKSTFAYWAPRISGKAKGVPRIWVNKQLQTPASEISDDVFRLLLWHELCHHILPAHGHDAEFRRLETMWPDFARLDEELDTLTERFDLGW